MTVQLGAFLRTTEGWAARQQGLRPLRYADAVARIGLSKRSFAGVTAKYETAFAKLRAEIDVMRAQVIKDLAARKAARTKAA